MRILEIRWEPNGDPRSMVDLVSIFINSQDLSYGSNISHHRLSYEEACKSSKAILRRYHTLPRFILLGYS